MLLFIYIFLSLTFTFHIHINIHNIRCIFNFHPRCATRDATHFEMRNKPSYRYVRSVRPDSIVTIPIYDHDWSNAVFNISVHKIQSRKFTENTLTWKESSENNTQQSTSRWLLYTKIIQIIIESKVWPDRRFYRPPTSTDPFSLTFYFIIKRKVSERILFLIQLFFHRRARNLSMLVN